MSTGRGGGVAGLSMGEPFPQACTPQLLPATRCEHLQPACLEDCCVHHTARDMLRLPLRMPTLEPCLPAAGKRMQCTVVRRTAHLSALDPVPLQASTRTQGFAPPVFAAQLDVEDPEEQRRIAALLPSLDLSAARVLILGGVPVPPQGGVLWLEGRGAPAEAWARRSPRMVVLLAQEAQVRAWARAVAVCAAVGVPETLCDDALCASCA
jgi:hypothetical protein